MALGIKSTALELIEKPVHGIHERPRVGPHASFVDGLWVVIEPMKVASLSTLYRGGEILGQKAEDSFKFLAPVEIQENIGHEWSEYESIASRIGQKIVEWRKTVRETQNIATVAKMAKDKVMDSGFMSLTMYDLAKSLEGGYQSTQKLDAALSYMNSPRRQYTFPFTLIDEGNPNMDIMDPVRKLIKMSCAEKVGLTSYMLPHLFKVYTEPNAIINVPYSVITAIQPTYKGPFRNGFPSICDLEVTFMDLSPLYKGVFEDIKQVTVSSTLMRHIPHYDKFKKFSSYNKRIQEQLGAYGVAVPGAVGAESGPVVSH